ncbi:MAG: VOC family protein [Woeseiaceae bacterium]
MKTLKNICLSLALALLGITACTTSSPPDIGAMSFSSEPLLGKVIWHDLLTEDIDSAREFYAGLFGWQFEESRGSRGEKYVLARKGDILVAGILGVSMPDDGNAYTRWLPYISVDDVDAAAARGAADGANVVVAPRNVGFGRVAAITDPEGAVIGIARVSIGDPDDNTTAAAPGRPVWTELLADDPAAAAGFYASMAGYDVRTIERRGGEYTLLSSDGIDRAGVFEKPSDTDAQSIWLTAFGVEDPAAAAAKAESLGGSILLPASPDLRDGTTAVITDPSGAVLVLRSWLATGEDE